MARRLGPGEENSPIVHVRVPQESKKILDMMTEDTQVQPSAVIRAGLEGMLETWVQKKKGNERLCVYLPKALYSAVESHAENEGRTLQSSVQRLIESGLQSPENPSVTLRTVQVDQYREAMERAVREDRSPLRAAMALAAKSPPPAGTLSTILREAWVSVNLDALTAQAAGHNGKA